MGSSLPLWQQPLDSLRNMSSAHQGKHVTEPGLPPSAAYTASEPWFTTSGVLGRIEGETTFPKPLYLNK